MSSPLGLGGAGKQGAKKSAKIEGYRAQMIHGGPVTVQIDPEREKQVLESLLEECSQYQAFLVDLQTCLKPIQPAKKPKPPQRRQFKVKEAPWLSVEELLQQPHLAGQHRKSRQKILVADEYVYKYFQDTFSCNIQDVLDKFVEEDKDSLFRGNSYAKFAVKQEGDWGSLVTTEEIRNANKKEQGTCYYTGVLRIDDASYGGVYSGRLTPAQIKLSTRTGECVVTMGTRSVKVTPTKNNAVNGSNSIIPILVDGSLPYDPAYACSWSNFANHECGPDKFEMHLNDVDPLAFSMKTGKESVNCFLDLNLLEMAGKTTVPEAEEVTFNYGVRRVRVHPRYLDHHPNHVTRGDTDITVWYPAPGEVWCKCRKCERELGETEIAELSQKSKRLFSKLKEAFDRSGHDWFKLYQKGHPGDDMELQDFCKGWYKSIVRVSDAENKVVSTQLEREKRKAAGPQTTAVPPEKPTESREGGAKAKPSSRRPGEPKETKPKAKRPKTDPSHQGEAYNYRKRFKTQEPTAYMEGGQMYFGPLKRTRVHHGDYIELLQVPDGKDGVLLDKDYNLIYNGAWEGGKYEGAGKQIMWNDTMDPGQSYLYTGGFVAGLRSGQGNLVPLLDQWSTTYDGEWSNGKQNGKGMCYYCEMNWAIQCSWKNGEKDGVGSIWDYRDGIPTIVLDGVWGGGKLVKITCLHRRLKYDKELQEVIEDEVQEQCKIHSLAHDKGIQEELEELYWTDEDDVELILRPGSSDEEMPDSGDRAVTPHDLWTHEGTRDEEGGRAPQVVLYVQDGIHVKYEGGVAHGRPQGKGRLWHKVSGEWVPKYNGIFEDGTFKRSEYLYGHLWPTRARMDELERISRRARGT